MKLSRKFFVVLCLLLLSAVIIETVIPEPGIITNTAEAASKVRLSQKKATMFVGEKLQLTVEGTKKKVKWSSSNKKIATVNKKGIVTAKKKGKVTITAKIGKKTYKCKITVKKAPPPTPTPAPTPTPDNVPELYSVRIKKYIAGEISFDEDLDIDTNGKIDSMDYVLARKIEMAYYDDSQDNYSLRIKNYIAQVPGYETFATELDIDNSGKIDSKDYVIARRVEICAEQNR